jgi:hypothetical protein
MSSAKQVLQVTVLTSKSTNTAMQWMLTKLDECEASQKLETRPMR